MLFLDYTPAQLHTCKSRWYIDYYAKNPLTDKLHRKTIKVNRIKNIAERRKFAKRLVVEINQKLASGWNPFIEQEAGKIFHFLFDAFDTYLKLKTKELRPDSIRTYKSNIKAIKEYCNFIYKGKKIYAITFTRKNAIDFLNYLYTEKDLSARVYNNYKQFGVTLWNWLIENNYCKTNVFLQISKKIEQPKKRIPIDRETRTAVKRHLELDGQIEFLAIIQLTFYALLRPKETLHLKPGNIDLKNRIITVPAHVAKTRKMRKVTISNTLFNTLKKLNISKINPDSYIFSTSYKPGTKLLNSRAVSKTWSKIREDLDLKKEMQFYSFKDSGIIQLLQDGVSPEIVRDQAGHSSLEMTNKYIQISMTEANKQILNKSKEF